MNQLEIVREECAQIADYRNTRIAEEIRNMSLPKVDVSENIIEENKTLRTMLCLTGSALPYMDDGEMQDNSVYPYIDYKRDSAEQIKSKLNKRAENAISNTNPTEGISLQDEYDTLKAQLESAIATISNNEDGYLTLEKLTAEIVAKQYDQIEALQKENARLQELATTKQDANSFLQKGISLPCDMSEREKFEAVMRRDASPLNNEIMEAAWFSWNAAVVTKVQLQSSTLKDSEGRVICKCDGTDQILAEIRELKEQLNKPKAQAVPGTNEATRKVLTARLEKVYADNKNIKATRLSDIERIVLMLTEAAIYTLNSIEDKA